MAQSSPMEEPPPTLLLPVEMLAALVIGLDQITSTPSLCHRLFVFIQA